MSACGCDFNYPYASEDCPHKARRMTTPSLPTPRPRSDAELLLAVQLEQAGIPFEREVVFANPRKFRADFAIGWDDHRFGPALLVEVEGGTWVGGRHVQGEGFASGCEKQYLATLKGYRYIRVTSGQVDDGTALAWIQQLIEQEETAA